MEPGSYSRDFHVILDMLTIKLYKINDQIGVPAKTKKGRRKK